jgi:predicted Zn-ribbon and HTH transcriptional regulator
MKIKPGLSFVINPGWNQKRLLRCGTCGRLFMGIKIPLLVKCPECGSLNVREDKRVLY